MKRPKIDNKKPIAANLKIGEEYLWLCQCKHSANKPFCDDKHREL